MAQGDRATSPGFSLASSTIFTTRESPSIYLTFQKVERLDFRIYKVRDPMAFVAGLKDPHQLGSETPPVDQEPTTLERIAWWKAAWRWRLRNFVRRQFSHDYRQTRRRLDDQQQVVRRRTEQVSTFAQVPLLNRSQLVTSWREILPPMRDPEVRRIPLELTAPGMYVVEAVSPPHRAYTVVIISDVGLVSKAAPGQVLLYAADRRTGTPVAGCEVRVIANQQPVVSGTTGADGVFLTTLEQTAADDVVSVARCDEQVTASDPGGWYLRESPRELVGYVFTDKPIYRPGHTVHLKALLRWRTRGALMPFDAADVEVRISDVTDKVIYRQRRKVDAFGGLSADVPLASGVALGSYSIAVLHGDDTASGGFEVQEYRRPEFEVRVSPAERFVVQGGNIVATVNARYYFGQPVANARLTYVAHKQPYYSPLRWSDEDEADGGGYWYGDDQVVEGTARLDANGNATIEVPAEADDNGRDYSLRIEARVSDASNREVSGNTLAHATFGTFLVAASIDTYVARPGGTVTLSVRAVSYTGVPQAATRIRVAVLARTPNMSWGDEGGTREVPTATVTTDADGRASWKVPVPSAAWRLPRARQRRVWRSNHRRRQLPLGAGRPAAHRRRLRLRQVSRAPRREEERPAWRDVAVPHSRRGVRLPGPGDQGSRGRFMASGRSCPWQRDHRGADHRRGHRRHVGEHRVPERRPAVPRRAQGQGAGASAANWRSRSPPARGCRSRRRPGVSRSRPSMPPAKPVRAQFALGVIDEAVYGVKADATADPLRFFYQRELQPRRHHVLARVLVCRLFGHSTADAGHAQAARTRWPTSRRTRPRSRRSARSSPTRSTGWPTW